MLHFQLYFVLLVNFVGLIFCAPVLKPQRAEPEENNKDDIAEQLDLLRKETGNRKSNLSVIHTNHAEIVEVNGQQHGWRQKEEIFKDMDNGQVVASVKQNVDYHKEPNEDGKAKTRTQIDLPRAGIHKDVVVGEKKNVHEDYNNRFSGIQYSPFDLAEYIVRTNDEEGVALAIEELLRQGMLNREDAIAYLQNVKSELNYMRSEYDKSRHMKALAMQVAQKQQQMDSEMPMQLQKMPEEKKKKEQGQKEVLAPAAPKAEHVPELKQDVPNVPVKKEHHKVHKQVHDQIPMKIDPIDSGEKQILSVNKEDPDIAAILERLMAANSAYEEYTLEEIIFQLTKDMFAQSIMKGDPTAEDTLTKLANFLEAEVKKGRISRDLEERVLEVMSAALVETLRDAPEMLNPGSGMPLAIPLETENRIDRLSGYLPVIQPMKKSDIKYTEVKHKEIASPDTTEKDLKSLGSPKQNEASKGSQEKESKHIKEAPTKTT